MLKTKKEQKQQSFMYATLIMALATVVVKILGLVFRIPITRLLGEVNMAYYSTAYDVYLPIYSIAMAGLPVAISIGAVSARQAGAIPFSIGPVRSELAPISFAPFKTRLVALVSVSNV